MNILFLTKYGRLGASSRLRSLQYLPWFENAGITCITSPLFDDYNLSQRYRDEQYSLTCLVQRYWKRLQILLLKNKFDLLWIEKEALPWFPAWFERLLLGGVPYILDYDDAIFHNYDLHRHAFVRHFFGKRIDSLMAGARLVLAGNAYLAKRAREAGAIWVEIVPTVIDLERYHMKSDFITTQDCTRIVWIGSPSTTRYLKMLRDSLVELGSSFAIKLRIIGGSTIDMPGVNVEVVPWTESTEVSSIQDSDIGVMPLLDSPWERGKCGYKLIQYMACGLPVVASPVGANCEIVRSGENGFFAKNNLEWVDALSTLLNDPPLRHRMGSVGRKIVENEYCIQIVAPRLTALLQAAVPVC